MIKEKIMAQTKEEKAAYMRKYNQRPGMKAKILASSTAWKKNNPKEYAIMRKTAKANETAKKFKCKGKLNVNDIRALITNPFMCNYCGKLLNVKSNMGKIWEIDHKIPLSRGGSNTPDNIVACDHACNRAKNNQTEEEFFEMIVEIYKYKGL